MPVLVLRGRSPYPSFLFQAWQLPGPGWDHLRSEGGGEGTSSFSEELYISRELTWQNTDQAPEWEDWGGAGLGAGGQNKAASAQQRSVHGLPGAGDWRVHRQGPGRRRGQRETWAGQRAKGFQGLLQCCICPGSSQKPLGVLRQHPGLMVGTRAAVGTGAAVDWF